MALANSFREALTRGSTREVLRSLGLIRPEEEPVVRRVLSAADARTYVDATLTSVLTLGCYLVRAGVFGSREGDQA
jgi:Zn-dependent membrane protease YugP